MSIFRPDTQIQEIDYIFLKSLLSGYAKPRKKIGAMLKSGQLIRVKKGLYVFGPDYAQGVYYKQTLANQIYGPSYISLYSALAHYQFIPERIEAVTSVTCRKNKYFSTPVGVFSYRYLSARKYCIGFTQVHLDPVHPILIATPEKAFADMFALEAKHIVDLDGVAEYLEVDLRVDVPELKMLDMDLLDQINGQYRSGNVQLLSDYLRRMR